MKKNMIARAVLLLWACLPAAVGAQSVLSLESLDGMAERTIAGAPLSGCKLAYSSLAEAEEGLDRANEMKSLLKDLTGLDLEVGVQPPYTATAIEYTHTADRGVFEYLITATNGKATIDGGGCWAMQYASKLLTNRLKKKNIDEGFKLQGTVEGLTLFARPEGVNLRILDDNIWQYDKNTIPDVWAEAGEDPRDIVRAPQFAQIVKAYMPDIFTMQEYSAHMDAQLASRLTKMGFTTATPSNSQQNYTPIFYRSAVLELLKANYLCYTPSQWSNAGTKSYTSAVFKHKSTGKIFAVITTHLWWQSDTNVEGSTAARAAQVATLLEEAKAIKAEYDCPIFVTGDMNCYEDSEPMQLYLTSGFTPCYKLATLYADNNNGHHVCGPNDIYSRKSNRRSAYREQGAIDHCLLSDSNDEVEIKVFDCIQAYFTIKLTDHYPNLIDAMLK